MTEKSPQTPLMHFRLFRSSVLAVLVLVPSSLYGYLWLMSPRINPDPQKRITQRGVFPFDRGWDLRVQQSFFAQNPTCSQIARVFFLIPQAEVSREQILPSIAVTRLAGSLYEVEYFEDHFLPGFCDWTPNFTYYRIYAKGVIVQGGAMLGFPHKYNRINYDCGGMRMPKTNELVTTCYEGNNRRFESSRKDAEVNFFWKEIEK